VKVQTVAMAAVAQVPSGELHLAEAAVLAPDEVLSRLVSGRDGLSSAEAAHRLRRVGSNALGTHRVSPAAVLLRQVRNPILILLLGAALVSGLTGGGTNALIIAVIVILGVGLGFFNEYRAEMAMAALRAQIRQEAEVRRDGRYRRLPVLDLVPGDVVALRIGGGHPGSSVIQPEAERPVVPPMASSRCGKDADAACFRRPHRKGPGSERAIRRSCR
jgi:Mg2+-importing ATPase